MIIGYTDGVFDLFHVGHLNMLQAAKEGCDYLIVGVHSDDVVEGYKGKKPIIPEAERCRIVGSIKGVDRAEITRFRDKIKLLDVFKFNRVFIGDDWKGTERWNNFEALLAKNKVDVVYIAYTKGISTKALRERIISDDL